MGRPGRTPSVVREAFRGPLVAGSDHIPPTRCHGSKQTAHACRVARVAKSFLHVRIACAAVYPVAVALRSRSLLCIGRSAPRLFFFCMVRPSAGSAGSCALQRVLEASLALPLFGLCTSCAMASLPLCTMAAATSHGAWRCTGSGCMASRVALFDARRTRDEIGAAMYCVDVAAKGQTSQSEGPGGAGPPHVPTGAVGGAPPCIGG